MARDSGSVALLEQEEEAESGSGEDRRVYTRTTTIIPVTWTDRQRPRGGKLKDVSERGLFLAPNWVPSVDVEPGQVIELRATAANTTFDLEAIVRWAGLSPQHLCAGYGLEVLSEEMLEQLLEISRKLAKKT